MVLLIHRGARRGADSCPVREAPGPEEREPARAGGAKVTGVPGRRGGSPGCAAHSASESFSEGHSFSAEVSQSLESPATPGWDGGSLPTSSPRKPDQRDDCERGRAREQRTTPRSTPPPVASSSHSSQAVYFFLGLPERPNLPVLQGGRPEERKNAAPFQALEGRSLFNCFLPEMKLGWAEWGEGGSSQTRLEKLVPSVTQCGQVWAVLEQRRQPAPKGGFSSAFPLLGLGAPSPAHGKRGSPRGQ